MNLYKFQYYWWLTHSLYTHKSSNLKPWGHKHKHRESQVYFECQSQAQINVRIAWGRAFSVKSVSNRTCGSIRCGDPLGNKGADKSAPIITRLLTFAHKKIASFTSLCSTISVLFHFKYYLYTKQNQKKSTFYNYNKSDFFCFVFLQNHFRQRDPRKFIMLIIRVSCNQSSSFIIKAIPKIKLHPVSQFFLCTL